MHPRKLLEVAVGDLQAPSLRGAGRPSLRARRVAVVAIAGLIGVLVALALIPDTSEEERLLTRRGSEPEDAPTRSAPPGDSSEVRPADLPSNSLQWARRTTLPVGGSDTVDGGAVEAWAESQGVRLPQIRMSVLWAMPLRDAEAVLIQPWVVAQGDEVEMARLVLYVRDADGGRILMDEIARADTGLVSARLETAGARLGLVIGPPGSFVRMPEVIGGGQTRSTDPTQDGDGWGLFEFGEDNTYAGAFAEMARCEGCPQSAYEGLGVLDPAVADRPFISGVLADGRSWRVIDDPFHGLCSSVGETYLGCDDVGPVVGPEDPPESPRLGGDRLLRTAVAYGYLPDRASAVVLVLPDGRQINDSLVVDETHRLWGLPVPADPLADPYEFDGQFVYQDSSGAEISRFTLGG